MAQLRTIHKKQQHITKLKTVAFKIKRVKYVNMHCPFKQKNERWYKTEADENQWRKLFVIM